MRPDLVVDRAVERSFGGHAADLDVDFAAVDRPALVTTLLASCSNADATTWWGSSVGARTAGLLRLVMLTGEHADADAAAGALRPSLRCPHCSDRIEAELPLAELVALEPAERAIAFGPYRLRRPTGADLRTMRTEGESVWLQAWRAESGLPAVQTDAALIALAQADPLVGFELTCRCPACGEAATIEVDLEALALQRLAAQQRRLLREVHALATQYGWSEAQILNLPAARRTRYLELIEGLAA